MDYLPYRRTNRAEIFYTNLIMLNVPSITYFMLEFGPTGKGGICYFKKQNISCNY